MSKKSKKLKPSKNQQVRLQEDLPQDIDEKLEEDRQYFQTHPFAQYYYRKPFDFEKKEGLQNCGKEPIKILVTQVGDGCRTREMIFKD